MAAKKKYFSMRIIHRYLGFFLAGIMTVYSLSGILLIFRDSDFLKQETHITKEVKKNAQPKNLGKLLGLKRIKTETKEDSKIYFQGGVYDPKTGIAEYTRKEHSIFLSKMIHLHKAKSSEPLFFLNVFFGASLLFFVISSFWMFMPKTSIFKKGIYFTLGGILLTLVLLFI
jgi:hypothetical protein